MKNIFIQLWEVYSKTEGIFSDGCSLHIDKNECIKFIEQIKSQRTQQVPDIYEKELGNFFHVNVSQELFLKLIGEKSIRISQTELSNLLLMDEISIENV